MPVASHGVYEHLSASGLCESDYTASATISRERRRVALAARTVVPAFEASIDDRMSCFENKLDQILPAISNPDKCALELIDNMSQHFPRLEAFIVCSSSPAIDDVLNEMLFRKYNSSSKSSHQPLLSLKQKAYRCGIHISMRFVPQSVEPRKMSVWL